MQISDTLFKKITKIISQYDDSSNKLSNMEYNKIQKLITKQIKNLTKLIKDKNIKDWNFEQAFDI